MLKCLVVELSDARRADYFDAICELPGIVAAGAVGSVSDARRILATERIDVIAIGGLPDADVKQLATLVEAEHERSIVFVYDTSDLVTQLEALVEKRRSKPAGSLALTRRKLIASPVPSAPSADRMQTLVLQDWLPAMCADFRRVIPEYIELVPIISGDTLPVRCVPDALEHEMLSIVLTAAKELPWGGTIWLTTEHVGSDTVRIDVLENGRGTGQDVTLQTSVAAS